jgi:DNA polymerase III delta prime subunit
MKQLWTEKYRPKTLDGYVFRDQEQKQQIEKWLDEKSIPHLLFSGSAGVGKTTLAKILTTELDIQQTDILFANGSKEGRKIEWVDKLINFCQTMPFGDIKVVIIDEADYLNVNSVQPALRNLMEEFSSNVRFILTCNYPNKIIPPLHSRCQKIHIEKVDYNEFTARVATILVEENIDFNLDVLDNYVASTYPDLRKCINNVQVNSINGTLITSDHDDDLATDYKFEMIKLFKEGKIGEARKLVCSQARPEEMEDIYRWLYDNVTIFGDDTKQEKAILIIKQGLVDHTLVSDPEINLAATLIRLAHVND